MLNLICRILIFVTYDSPVPMTDAVIWLLSCSLNPLSLHNSFPMAMDAMMVILETCAEMVINSSPHAIMIEIMNIKSSLPIKNDIRIQW